MIAAPFVSWAASLSLSLWFPGHGLMCGAGAWLSEDVSNPCPVSLADLSSAGFCLVRFQSSLLLMILGHLENAETHRHRCLTPVFT